MNKSDLHPTDRLPGSGDHDPPRAGGLFGRFHFVAFCEPVPVASRNERCQTHGTVGLLVLALMGTPTGTLIASDIPRLI
jgi:hypothetical protein